MSGFFREIKNIYSKEPLQPYRESFTPLSAELDGLLEKINNDFGGSADITVRRTEVAGIRTAIISVDNMIDKQVLAEGILEPFFNTDFSGDAVGLLEELGRRILCTAETEYIDSYEALEGRIMSGCAVLAADGSSRALSVGIQGYASRGVSEPQADIVQRGSKEGFVEAVRVNMTMIRKRLKTPQLCFESMVTGRTSRTEIILCYLRDAAAPELLDTLKKRLSEVPLDTVLTAGYLVPFLEDDKGHSLFCGIGISERPDTVCGKLTEGRIAVLVDGVPSALIAPCIFAEYFQSLDDYSNRAYFATFTRILKYIAFLISVLLPGLFVSLGTFDPEMFPTLMLNKIASSIASTPLSLTAETLLILFIYEIMREAGLRMPRPLGYAVSIVGGLVVGDTAVSAGLIGAPTLMVVAVSAISSYVVPDLYAPSAVLRFAFTLAAGALGIWGVAVVFSIALVDLCGKTSFGVPYTSPVTPFSAATLRDVVIRAGWRVLSKKTERVQELPGADIRGESDE